MMDNDRMTKGGFSEGESAPQHQNQYDTKLLTPTKENLLIAAREIKSGRLVGMPTETVYGLAANALDEDAVASIFKVKGRPADNPLIAHICCMDQLNLLARDIPQLAYRLAERFWPGPFTMVLDRCSGANSFLTGGLDTVAVRMPAHEVALALITQCNTPLAAPSANPSGRPSPTTAEHVYNDLYGQIGYILDGGGCDVGVESTVVRVYADRVELLRPGAVTVSEIQSVTKGRKVMVAKGVTTAVEDEVCLSPGLRYKHYSPKAKVVLLEGGYGDFCRYVAKRAVNSDSRIGVMLFDDDERVLDLPYVTYGGQTDVREQAKRLFSSLRALDSLDVDTVYARFYKDDELGLAVYNRLIRAAGFEVVTL